MTTVPRSEKRRAGLLRSALERFAAEGYEAATTRDIAAGAGVSETVLFRHFPAKHAIFVAVIREFGPAELFRHLPDDDWTGKPFPDALRWLVTEYLDTTWRHRAWLRVLFQEAGRDPEAAEALAGQYRGVGQVLYAIFGGLRGCRTICASPFAEDAGRVIYCGGFDATALSTNTKYRDTAWIYKGTLPAAQ